LLASASTIAETEPGAGELAALVLQNHPALRYTGVFREIVNTEASERTAAFGSRGRLVKGGAEGELPLQDKSQDILLTCHALEGMRMNHLYMVCSEARRVLREGGHWLILARDPGRNAWEKLVSYLRAKAGRPSLNVTHYISPEDWQTEQDTFLPGMNRMLILRRWSALALPPNA
jgi:ubiquinone/menaquinone biosynthesis C-methylase UbiE